jgi:hypothetical protein
VPWCRFFIPKIASPDVKPGDPDINDHIMYAKCVKGHVLKGADQWLLCENLPAPEALCWQEGGDTLFSLQLRKRSEKKGTKEAQAESRAISAAQSKPAPQASKP